MGQVQSQTEWEEEMGKKVLAYIRDELCVDFPYFDTALRALEPVANERLQAFATEGLHLFFPPAHYLQVFEENEQFLMRAYLHVLFHCLYAHLWTRGARAERRWNLACDIAVESVIDRLERPSTKRLLSWSRSAFYQTMQEQKLVSAAQIYDYLEQCDERQQADLAREFYTDDHGLWGKKQMKAPSQGQDPTDEAQKKWQKIAKQTQFKRAKSESGEKQALAQKQARIEKAEKRRTYREFLIQFAAYHEQLHVTDEAFDLNYYTYGLREYQNLLLLEPLETREEKRIQEFVIAVDSSYSTSGDLIRHFLRETLDILLEKNMFFSTARVHILQCDDQVQEHLIVTRDTNLSELFGQFEIKGGGGTDFRPVFSYVEQLRAEGKLTEPGGLLYFTDGNGIYPKNPPDYKCAFIYMEDYDKQAVPAWAIRLRLEKEDKYEYRTGEGRN